MEPVTPGSLCDTCKVFLAADLPKQPHVLMRLRGAQAPNSYTGLLERHYICSSCKTVWRRRTRMDGLDVRFEILPPAFYMNRFDDS